MMQLFDALFTIVIMLMIIVSGALYVFFVDEKIICIAVMVGAVAAVVAQSFFGEGSIGTMLVTLILAPLLVGMMLVLSGKIAETKRVAENHQLWEQILKRHGEK